MGDAVSGEGVVAKGHPPRSWNTPEVVARLGKVPDAELAAELGFSVHTIRSERVRRGIHMVRRQEEYDEFLGLISDAELSRLKNVSRQAVSARRARLAIPECAGATDMALLLLEVKKKGVEGPTSVSIPTDLYERICDLLTR